MTIPMGRDEAVRLYREHHALTGTALARKAAFYGAYLSGIETRKKPGTAWKRRARSPWR